ncbi:PTS system mannose/fructose/sorbose family transporter subunit IID [Dielma fastidiosa]|uniref:PTS system mannose-specific IID component/fructoselysine and glucoselysine-specific PTS system IID component n=1 Tax=Dielma fastidiosa TaxID=1034346 RepID=A0A318KTP5_9FIRM|nr:PTS system mannose/fructose/sorbose family transporter subunit IID [Dielma fastidiosa]MDY5167684.1 PTS system mannose/fructose/sorbose family transporter subunit IID [Dielma fastidiosa]PXX79075.1 PTS system mannose-specific IID component/fructoselysine and glucoselysine-specific PTS system IID component [Dielma fastidiosa]
MTKTNIKSNQLTKEDKEILKKSYYYSMSIMMSTNQITQQSKCYAMCMKPGLDIWYKENPDEKRKAFFRHANEFFNTNSTLFPLVTGISLAMEKKKALDGGVSDELITSVKTSLMGPTAGIGDSIINNCFRTIIAGIAIGFGNQGSLLGPLIFLFGFGGVLMIAKWFILKAGYQGGMSLIDKAFEQGIVPLISKCATIVGAIMIGALCATNVKVKIVSAPMINGAEVVVQNIFDSIAPGLLSILLFAWVFRRLQKGMNPTLMIFVLILGSILLAAIGIF